MLTLNRELFESNEFALQIISSGAFADNGVTPERTYIVEAITLRLNWVALNDWNNAHTYNSRDCYEDGPTGDAEWKYVLEKNKSDLKTFETKIRTALGIEQEKRIIVNQVHSEVFTVVNVYPANSGKEPTQ